MWDNLSILNLIVVIYGVGIFTGIGLVLNVDAVLAWRDCRKRSRPYPMIRPQNAPCGAVERRSPLHLVVGPGAPSACTLHDGVDGEEGGQHDKPRRDRAP